MAGPIRPAKQTDASLKAGEPKLPICLSERRRRHLPPSTTLGIFQQLDDAPDHHRRPHVLALQQITDGVENNVFAGAHRASPFLGDLTRRN